MKFRFLKHTADVKFRVYGKTLNEIFENSALAFSNQVSRGKSIKEVMKKNIEIEGDDIESLLYMFLDELIFLMDYEGFIVSKAVVNMKNKKLKAFLWGDNIKNYKDLNPVKAATYSEMYIKKTPKGFEGQVVLDI